MKNEKFYKPLIITLGIALSLIVVFYVNEEKQISTKEGLTGVDGSTIYLETPIEPNGYIDQMVDDSSNIELDAQNLLNTYSGSLSSTDTTNLTNIIQNQQNIKTGLSTVKTDYTTVLSSLENETNALVSLRTDAIEEKRDQYDTLVNERQNKRRLVKTPRLLRNNSLILFIKMRDSKVTPTIIMLLITAI